MLGTENMQTLLSLCADVWVRLLPITSAAKKQLHPLSASLLHEPTKSIKKLSQLLGPQTQSDGRGKTDRCLLGITDAIPFAAKYDFEVR